METLKQTQANNTVLDLKSRIAELQIALLREEIKDKVRQYGHSQPRVLAPTTPSPKKRKRIPPVESAATSSNQRKDNPVNSKPVANEPDPSNFLMSLSNFKRDKDEDEVNKIERSSGFSSAPPPLLNSEQRDDHLQIVENLEVGPKYHTPSSDDPEFQTREPNSGIYLRDRSLPHDDLQEYLRGRFFLPPSMLYSIARPLPGNQGYDVPVEGDWVTIAVIAERGAVKMTSSTQAGEGKVSSQKFLSLKLVDLGMNNSIQPGRQTRGDALLNLLLFEAQSVSKEVVKGSTSDRFAKKIYKGGSGGAYEACAALKEGTVLAVLNPRILKPFRRGETSSLGGQILAITPSSADAILVIGQARDLGSCTVMKRGGSTCGSWYDKRSTGGRSVCEWHFMSTVQGQRNQRAEFSNSTSTLKSKSTASQKTLRKKDREETYVGKKAGLLPSTSQLGGVDGEAVYMYSGTTIRAGGAGQIVEEKIGRGRQERLKRKRENIAAENALAKLRKLQPDDHAAFSKVETAQRAMLKLDQDLAENALLQISGSTQHPARGTKITYSSSLIKNLGFNPSSRAESMGKTCDANTKQKLEALQIASSNRIVQLSGRPGRKHSALAPPMGDQDKKTIQSLRSEDSDLEIEDPIK